MTGSHWCGKEVNRRQTEEPACHFDQTPIRIGYASVRTGTDRQSIIYRADQFTPNLCTRLDINMSHFRCVIGPINRSSNVKFHVTHDCCIWNVKWNKKENLELHRFTLLKNFKMSMQFLRFSLTQINFKQKESRVASTKEFETNNVSNHLIGERWQKLFL